jgi:hypothetical protein
MSSSAQLQILPQLTVERRYTRDWPAPISADDYEMETGWRRVRIVWSAA